MLQLNQYLSKCAELSKSVFDEESVKIVSYDFNSQRMQKDNELVVNGEVEWGTNPKMLLKHLSLRFFPSIVDN